MKKYSYIILAALVVATGCKKIIDLQPESNLTLDPVTHYKDLDEVSVALTGCYNGMQKTLTEEWTLTELRSDNSIMGVPGSTASPNRDLSDLDMFMPNTSHQGNFNYWSSVYYNIKNINLALDAMNVNYSLTANTISYDTLKIAGTDANRKALAAEALFLRAYHYFNLVRLYGGVFLVDEPITPEQALKVNRSSVSDIYKLIEADLSNAINYGSTSKYSATSATLGRVNSWCAKALLAKVYLTQNKKAEAITLLQDVITNSGYSLQTSYANIFSISNEMNSEILFAIRFRAGGIGLGSLFPNSFAPLSSGSNVVNGDGKGLNYPSTDINNSYFSISLTGASVKKDSSRVVLSAANTSILPGMYVTGTQVASGTTVSSIVGNVLTLSIPATATTTSAALVVGDPRKVATIAVYNPGTKLYPVKLISNPSLSNDAENDWVVLRLADVILMLAEAQGNSVSSINLINQIRSRAKLNLLDPVAINTTALFETALANERRYEFAFENQRYFDLMRYNTTMTTITAVQSMKDHFAKEYTTHYGQYPAPRLTLAEIQAQVTTNKLLLPIPQREIDNNTRIVIPQNPGY
jgi:hypothetical protein